MRVIRVEGIEKCEDSEEIVWHNWNIITNKGEIICYDIKFLEKTVMKIQIILENEICLNLGIGIIKIFPSMMILPYICKKIFDEFLNYQSINTYLIKGDRLGDYIFKCAGFKKVVEWRRYVQINRKKYDVLIYTNER